MHSKLYSLLLKCKENKAESHTMFNMKYKQILAKYNFNHTGFFAKALV